MASAFYLTLRDVAKELRYRMQGVRARLFWVDRGPGSSIATSVRLDVMQQGETPSGRFKLGARSFVEIRAVINSWIGDVTIGDNSGIGIGSIIIGPVSIGDNCRISQNCFICAENRTRGESGVLSKKDFDVRPIDIGNRVWIGTGAIILPGVQIGDDATIGAGAVVTKNVASGAVVVGPSAKAINSGADSDR